jgi:hypothetical protein
MEGWKCSQTRRPRLLILTITSALPAAYQDLIIDKTLAAKFPRVDANSGFEPRSFRPETAERWKRLPLVAWRFAYDELAELPAVMRMMQILHDAGVSRKRHHIYCLASNEPIAACEEA